MFLEAGLAVAAVLNQVPSHALLGRRVKVRVGQWRGSSGSRFEAQLVPVDERLQLVAVLADGFQQPDSPGSV